MAHLDLENCAIALAVKVLPLLLTRSSMLARYGISRNSKEYPYLIKNYNIILVLATRKQAAQVVKH